MVQLIDGTTGVTVEVREEDAAFLPDCYKPVKAKKAADKGE